ncbi:hypothetical protein CXF97_07010 [Pseudomonas sp. Choline-02u-1]|nr:hypothetical protein CXF97_07010 [Pseudomonas sp. Choline-02u-1]
MPGHGATCGSESANTAIPCRSCRRLRSFWDAERPQLHSHAERGNDQRSQPSAAPTGIVVVRFDLSSSAT